MSRVVERTTDGEVTPSHKGQGHRTLTAGLGGIITDLLPKWKLSPERGGGLPGVPLASKHGAQTDQPLSQG